jgi:transaldolase
MHWSEFIGGDVVISPPYKWQLLYNASDVAVVPRMHRPVEQRLLDELYNKFADFRRAYDEDGMTAAEFDEYGATRRTLRGFIAGLRDLCSVIRDFMIPDPDVG